MLRELILLLATSVALCSQMGCGNKSATTKAGGGPPEMVVPVETARVTTERLEDKLSAVGTLDANESVDIKSEIDAVVEKIQFNEGSAVKKGQLLLQFDAAKWQAQHQQAR